MKRVFVTGSGLVSSIGNSVEENLKSLRAGICGISKAEFLNTSYTKSLLFGEIKIRNEEIISEFEINNEGVTRTALLALKAVSECINSSGLTKPELESETTALVGATTVGGMCLTDELYLDANSDHEASPFIDSYDAGAATRFLIAHFKIGGYVNTMNTACSSSANSIIFGSRLIKHGFARRAIVGGVDSLAKFTINGFNSLHILAAGQCMPFDNSRSGLNLGEGAGFLVLESEEVVGSKPILGEITGYANTNDAFHPSSLSDEGKGPVLSMKHALQMAHLKKSDISYVNTHGTGTENNDLIESRAMIKVFETPPPFSSTKSNIGHTLGAAGSIEAIYSLLNLQHQEVFPAINFKTPIQETGLIPVTKNEKLIINHVMSNSFGFGGNCTTLIISKT
ncbi:MAG TPA: beta-ketoacyl-[acyl-carrier-protein] synthase family protein [Cyclobacteriaceae bacterium]